MELTKEQILDLWGSKSEERAAQDVRHKYFVGDHAILDKANQKRSDGGVYNAVVANWISNLVERHVGFLAARPFTVSPNDRGDQAAVAAVDGYNAVAQQNDLASLDERHFQQALIYGYSVETIGVGSDARLVIQDYDPRQWAFALDQDDNEIAAVRRLDVEPWTVYRGEWVTEPFSLFWVFDESKIRLYRAEAKDLDAAPFLVDAMVSTGVKNKSANLQLEDEREHFFDRLPVFRWKVDGDCKPYITDALMVLQDAYNTAISEHLDDTETDIQAILAMYGMSPKDLLRERPEGEEDAGKRMIDVMRERKAFVFPDSESRAEFITRDLPTEKISWTEGRLRQLIHTMGSAPDIDEIVGATGRTSGIALRLQFQPMIELASKFSKYIEASLRTRIGLLNQVWGKVGLPALQDYDVTVTYSVPSNETEIWTAVNSLEPLLSRVDRLKLVPSIDDPQAAAERKEEETAANAPVAPAAEPAPVFDQNPTTAAVREAGNEVVGETTVERQTQEEQAEAGAQRLETIVPEFLTTTRMRVTTADTAAMMDRLLAAMDEMRVE